MMPFVVSWHCSRCPAADWTGQHPRVIATHRENAPLTASDPKITEFLHLWHEGGRAEFERDYTKLDYDSTYYQHTAKDRRKYIALDAGTGGRFLVDRIVDEEDDDHRNGTDGGARDNDASGNAR